MSEEVINWDEAMQQCGEDEEFLRELLDDLRSETDAQMEKIEETIRKPGDKPMVQIMRAAHVVKGAASNLMCGQLRECAKELENAASAASSGPDGDVTLKETVKAKYEDLKTAVENYHKYLKSVDV